MCGGGDDGRCQLRTAALGFIVETDGQVWQCKARDVKGQISVRACSRCMMALRIPRSSLSDSQTASWSCDAGWRWARARGLVQEACFALGCLLHPFHA